MSVKIGVISMPPVTTSCALDEICPDRGLLVTATRLACDFMHLNCSFSWYNGSEYGDVDDRGLGNGLVGAIQRGEFDTSVPIFTPTYRRFEAIQFGEMFDREDFVLVTRAPTTEQDLDWSIVKAFRYHVWISFLITLLLVVCFIVLALQTLQRKATFSNKPSTTYFDLSVALMTNEFNNSLLRFHSIRILVCLWILGAVVLTGAYTGKLFSSRLLAKTNLPYTNLETFVQCLENRKCRIIASAVSSSSLKQLTSSGADLGDRIQASLLYNPVQLASSKEIATKILKQTNQYLVNVAPKTPLINVTSGNLGDCLYYTVDLNYAETFTFPFAKNSSYLRKFNKMTLAFREFGLVEVLRKKHIREPTCDDKWKSGGLWQSQTLISLMPTFDFYALGMFGASIAFSVEVLVAGFSEWLEKVIMPILIKVM